jgi:hypothetical protein
LLSGFLIIMEMTRWEPTVIISWLGYSPIYETPFRLMYKVQHLFENRRFSLSFKTNSLKEIH